MNKKNILYSIKYKLYDDDDNRIVPAAVQTEIGSDNECMGHRQQFHNNEYSHLLYRPNTTVCDSKKCAL